MFVPVMWLMWSLLVLVSAAIKIYKGRLAFDEDDQIFLDDSFGQEIAAQKEIADRVNRIEPIQHKLLWVLAADTLFVIGYYIVDMINQFKV